MNKKAEILKKKAEIFDIIREQELLQMKFNELEEKKRRLALELQELERQNS